MKTRLAFIPVLLLVALVGCGDSNSTADNTEAERMKDRIASLEKELEAKQKPDAGADAVAAAEERAKAAEERAKAAEAAEERAKAAGAAEERAKAAKAAEATAKAAKAAEERAKVAEERRTAANPKQIDFVDIADDPEDYLKQTVTFLVWLKGRDIGRARLTTGVLDGGDVVLDGYLLVFEDGARPLGKGDRVGNPLGFFYGRNKINWFMEKDYGRQIRDNLDNDRVYKMRVTCTLKSVKGYFYNNVAFITKLELP